MSYTNYENNIISAETEIFTAERTTLDVEETAILLVTKSLAEANAEEILDLVLDNAFDRVCLQTPGYIRLCAYDKPIVSTPSNILSVLEMESNLPIHQKTKNYYHSDHSNESGDESTEEPVFTSPIYVKSGPENINILQETSTAKSCDMSEGTPDIKQQPQKCDSIADIKYEAHENISEPEGLKSDNNDHTCANLDSTMNNTVCHPCENLSKSDISEKEDTEHLENIGDANDTVNIVEKIEPKSSTSGQKISLAGKVIGDVVPKLNISDGKEIHVQPQVVQTYVLYPGSPAKDEDVITAKNENTLATELEGDAFDRNSLNKDEDTSSSTNEANVETPLVANEVGDLLNYFEQVNNTVDLRVQIVDNASDEGIANNRICEEVKRAVKEIAAAVFEGQGDGTSTELSNLSIQQANRQEQSKSEIQAVISVQPQSTDQSRSTPMDSEKSQKNSEESDGEEVIAVHETLSVDSDIQDFLSEMHKHDEMDEREVQIILRDDEGETESLNGAAFNSDYPQCSNYLAASGMASQDEVDDFSYCSDSEINLSLKRSYLDTARLTQVVEEPYSLQTMVRNIEKKNSKAKVNLTIGKTTSSRQALGPIKIEQSCEELCSNKNAEDMQDAEDTPIKIRDSRWRRIRNILTCYKSRRQSSDDL